jgi:hypothetical protein
MEALETRTTGAARRWMARGLPRAGMVVAVLAAHACGQIPELVDTLGSPVDQTEVLFDPDLRQTAPVIAAAYVVDNAAVRRRVPAARMPGILLDLHRVHARVEVAIRGDVGAELEFYYFVQADDSPGNNPRYRLMFEAEPGRRYIFFLCREGAALRSVGDVGEYSLKIFSGAHRNYRPPAKDAATAVQDILLKRGEGSDPAALVYGLQFSVVAANRWGSRLHAIQLLRELLAEPEPVRSAACDQLVFWYSGQYSCLYRIRDDPAEPEAARDHARAALAKQGPKDARLIEMLRDPAGLDFPVIGRADSRRAVLEELESLLDSPNALVREEACVALARYYPYETNLCVR